MIKLYSSAIILKVFTAEYSGEKQGKHYGVTPPETMVRLKKKSRFTGLPGYLTKMEKFLLGIIYLLLSVNENQLKLFIKNMTSLRSKKEVKGVMENLGLHPVAVEIGEIEIEEKLSLTKYDALRDCLLKSDFELVADKEMILIEKIKCVIIEMIHYSDELPDIKYSDYISKKLKINYTYLSKLFSRAKRITIEHFIIAHKIERVKQLLLYNELTLSEIAWKLHYSSTAHLSAQFKKVTGLTPSFYKKLKYKKLILPEDL